MVSSKRNVLTVGETRSSKRPAANQTSNLTVSKIRKLKNVTRIPKLIAFMREHDLDVSDTEFGMKRSFSKWPIIVSMIVILALQGVLAYFAQAGGNFVMEGGRWVSLVISAIGMLGVIFTANKWIPRQYKYIVLVIEGVIMTVNALIFMPAYFARQDASQAAAAQIAASFEKATNFHNELEAYGELNNSVHASALAIAQDEMERSGKGIVYTTAIGIAAKIPERQIDGALVLPPISSDVSSIKELNDEIIKANNTIKQSINTAISQAKGIQQAAASSIEQVNNLVATKGLSEQQFTNAMSLKGSMNQLANQKFEFVSEAPTLESLPVNWKWRALSIGLDILLVFFIFVLIIYVYKDEENSIKDAIAETQRIALQELLTKRGIKYEVEDFGSDANDFRPDESDFRTFELMESSPSFVSKVNRENLSYQQIKTVVNGLGKSAIIEHIDSNATYPLSKLEKMASDPITGSIPIAELIKNFTSADIEQLTGLHNAGVSIADYRTEHLKIILQIVKMLKKKLNGKMDEIYQYMSYTLTELGTDVGEDVLNTWYKLVSALSFPNVIKSVSGTMLYLVSGDIEEEYVELIKTLHTNEDKSMQFVTQWGDSDTRFMQELIKAGLYDQRMRSVMIILAKSKTGLEAIRTLFAQYEAALDEAQNDTEVIVEQKIILNPDSAYYVKLQAARTPAELGTLLDTLFQKADA